MILGIDLKSFFDNIYASYEALPNEGKMIIYVIFILIIIVVILIVIMFEQTRWNKKLIANKKIEVSENTEILDFSVSDVDIDETNEKTRNLKEITDKIQAVLDNKNIDLTRFEQDQEESSIISYDELMKTVGKKVETTKQEFSLPELVRKIEVDEEIEKETPFVSPPREDKFKTSVFISPVFGIQDQTRTIIKEEPKPIKLQEEVYKQESTKEEELFLTNLINFRKNLE